MVEILTPVFDHPSICGKMRRFSNPASASVAGFGQARRTGPSQTLL